MDTTKSKNNGEKIFSDSKSKGEKTLIAYFSWGGTTKRAAEYIKTVLTYADIFEIASLKEYPKDYRKTTQEAKQELNTNYLPELKNKIGNIKQYDTVILAYPNWWSTIPQAVKRFLLDYSMEGKTIMPFCTHGGGGEGRSISDIKKLCQNSFAGNALVIRDSAAVSSNDSIKEWIHKTYSFVK